MKKYILHLDTSGNDSHISLAADGILLFNVSNSEQKNHASNLNGIIAEVMQTAGIGMADLSAIAVIGGPGSYTGLRIGLATAKGICYALDIPLLMHNKLELLALEKREKYDDRYHYYMTILPARNGEYFITVLDNKGVIHIPPVHIEGIRLAALIRPFSDHSVLVTGDPEIAFKDDTNPLITHEVNQQIDLGLHARKALDDLICNRIVNLYSVEPFYLKAPFTYSKL